MIRFVNFQNIRQNLIRLLVIVGITLCTIGQTAGAQTRFAKRDTVPDVSKYVTMEDCMIALGRITKSEELKLPYWPDTIELVGGEELKPLPVAAQDFTARCIAKFNPDSVDLDSYIYWIRLYLSAGNDKTAQLIAKRIIDLSSWDSQDSSKLLSRTIGNVLSEYTKALPRRTELARSLIDFYLEGANQPISLEHRVGLYFSKASQELANGDTATARVWANKILSIIDSSANSARDSVFMKKQASSSIAAARDIIERDVLMDSLRVSGQAYATLKRSIWKDIPDGPAKEHINMIGEKARPLVGEFIYSRNGERLNGPVSLAGASSPSTVSYPTSGKVSLVVFLYGGCREESPSIGNPGKERDSYRTMCLDGYTILHRIAKRYPELDITIVTKTLGYLGWVGPLTPEDEADSLRWLWLENHKLPARLVVANTENFRLPGLDRRRIDHPNENSANYSYLMHQRRGGELRNKTVYLIDSDGTILETGGLSTGLEKSLKPILDIITKRAK